MPENTNGSRPARDAAGKFKPGVTGNPGGRPKGLASAIRETVPAEDLRAYYEAIWRMDTAALKRLKIPVKSVTLRDRNDAASWLTDRGYGKAPAFAPLEGGDPLELEGADRAVAELADELAARRASQAPGEDAAAGGEAAAAGGASA